jgi:hypothetical protein
MARWLFSRRLREAEKAWAIYRGVGSDEPMPILFHAGFSMGASAFALAAADAVRQEESK